MNQPKKLRTTAGKSVDAQLLHNYFHTLTDLFFKILPMKEDNEPSLPIYLRSLQMELLGCQSLIRAVQYDPRFISLLSILQYFISYPECPVSDVKREVFRAISICGKLEAKYSKGGETRP